MSQDDLARALREVGCSSATKRLVQRWESGETLSPRPTHARALERVLGKPIEVLGFMALQVSDDGHGGHDVDELEVVPQADRETPAPRPRPNPGNYSGIWLSRYDYFSSGRQETFTVGHYVVILQHGAHLTVRSLPGTSLSVLGLELDVDSGVATGTWSEQTDVNGYYRGAHYHGAIQLLVEPTGYRMVGKWIGYGKNFDINSGPWKFVLQNPSTSKATIELFNRPADLGETTG